MADRNKSKKRTLVEYMELLSTTHTMRIKEICRMLKCSRTYVDSNIVSYFKDSNGIYKVYLGFCKASGNFGHDAIKVEQYGTF